MGAPTGNQFWKLRSKHGRDRLFESPELLLEAAYEYFEWCEKNPLIEFKPMVVSGGGNNGSSIEMAEINKLRPFTLIGFSHYCHASESWLKEFRKSCPNDFLPVIEHIEEVIKSQKFSGAAAGLLNANIISRDLGLADKREMDVKVPEGIVVERRIFTKDEQKKDNS